MSEDLKCIDCGAKLVKKKYPCVYKNKKFGVYLAEICNGCGAVYFPEESVKKIEKRAKELGVWGKVKC